jgi:transcriptional regulator with XRE-family HTH domain
MPLHSRKHLRRNLRLKGAIAEAGLKQYVVARRAGISETRLSKYIGGVAVPTPDEQARLARVLRRDIPELFDVPAEPAVA